MAEHPILLNEDKKQVKLLVRQPGQAPASHVTESVVENKPQVSEPKKTVGQRLSAYAFGEEVAQPGKYVWDSYLAPTGKRVANDIVEHFLLMIKHTFQRWIWHGKTLDDGKWIGDRTSFSKISGRPEPIKASVMMSPVKELTFDTKEDANNVLNQLKYAARENEDFGAATVREYYEASGCPNLVETNGVSSSSGWKREQLEKVSVKENPDGGWTLNLPRPQSLASK